MDSESCKNRIAELKTSFKQQTAKEQRNINVSKILSDILFLEKQTDPIELRYGLMSVIDRLQLYGLSEEDAIIRVRAFTINTNILACLDGNPETSISQN